MTGVRMSNLNSKIKCIEQIGGMLFIGVLSGFCVANLEICIDCYFSCDRHPYLWPFSRVCVWVFGMGFLCVIIWTLIQMITKKIRLWYVIMRVLLGAMLGIPFYHIWIIAVEAISYIKIIWRIGY